MAIFGWSVIAAPTVWPYPLTILTTPGGNPAWMMSEHNLAAVNGVTSLGFKTTALPAAKAGPNLNAIKNNGKFQGVIWPQIPIGSSLFKLAYNYNLIEENENSPGVCQLISQVTHVNCITM